MGAGLCQCHERRKRIAARMRIVKGACEEDDELARKLGVSQRFRKILSQKLRKAPNSYLVVEVHPSALAVHVAAYCSIYHSRSVYS